ncbi:hypothetical protein V9T40_002998 [Parthenolecanium corni]|uniref:Uncharacterized protein n=1 Tax=Parthenolecanium corni TaxID=536013 RepID=A0AAN9U0L2_9HEMI
MSVHGLLWQPKIQALPTVENYTQQIRTFNPEQCKSCAQLDDVIKQTMDFGLIALEHISDAAVSFGSIVSDVASDFFSTSLKHMRKFMKASEKMLSAHFKDVKRFGKEGFKLLEEVLSTSGDFLIDTLSKLPMDVVFSAVLHRRDEETEGGATEEYQYEGCKGIKKQFNDVHAFAAGQVTSAAAKIGVAYLALGSNIANQTLKKTHRLVDGTRSTLVNGLELVQNVYDGSVKAVKGLCGNWIEIAYGTSSGTVRVIVQHPETVGHGPQLFQTFTVHQSPVTKVTLSEKYLVSVCCEYNHVRTWSVTRFRGMISTQPGSTPVASFKIVSLEEVEPCISYAAGNDCGPFGEQDDEQVFVQKVVPETPELYVRLASNGKRVCVIRAVDGVTITCFCVHECDGSSRMGSRPRRFIFTGHSNGALQMWDLTTALDMCSKFDHGAQSNGGPSAEELIRLLDQCDLSNSHCSTPCISPCPSLLGPAARIKASNMAFLNQSIVQQTEPTQNASSTNASAPPSNSVNNSSNNNNAPSSSSSSSNPLF